MAHRRPVTLTLLRAQEEIKIDVIPEEASFRVALSDRTISIPYLAKKSVLAAIIATEANAPAWTGLGQGEKKNPKTGG